MKFLFEPLPVGPGDHSGPWHFGKQSFDSIQVAHQFDSSVTVLETMLHGKCPVDGRTTASQSQMAIWRSPLQGGSTSVRKWNTDRWHICFPLCWTNRATTRSKKSNGLLNSSNATATKPARRPLSRSQALEWLQTPNYMKQWTLTMPRFASALAASVKRSSHPTRLQWRPFGTGIGEGGGLIRVFALQCTCRDRLVS
jgi:hypothetical protein